MPYSTIDRQAKIMLARYYDSSLGRFMAVDPASDSARQEQPQTWNRYIYARNNPLARIDPDGRKDKRTDEDKKILEDKDVKAKTREAWEKSNADAKPEDRQEVGFGVTETTSGDFETTELQTQGDPALVTMAVDPDSAATVHTHPLGNASVRDAKGERKQARKKPGKTDKKLAADTGAPAFVVAKNKMYRVDPKSGKVKVVLSRKHFREYMGQQK
jgi:RHS repeat-associated protein